MSTLTETTAPAPTDRFFHDLTSTGRVPLLKRANGTIRFDLRDGDRTEHWHLTIAEGDVTCHKRRRTADGTVRADKAMFDELVCGRLNAIAALLRGDVEVEGDLGLIILFQRIFPAPDQPNDDSPPNGRARRKESRS